MHARRSRSEWQKIIREFERSGETHSAFCVARSINVGSFRGWLYRLRRVEARSRDVQLVPVDVARTELRTDAIAPLVVRVGDVEIDVARGSDAAYVARLVAELRRC
jgi:hypothetical protein